MRLISGATAIIVAGAITSCTPKPEADASKNQHVSAVRLDSEITDPLPLRVSYLDLMTGVIGASAFPVFELSKREQPMTASEWVRVGAAATNLIAMSSLLSMEGSSPEDRRRFNDPDWIKMVGAFRDASLGIAAAAAQHDRDAFVSSAVAVGQSCQTCHAKFDKAPPAKNTDLANTKGGNAAQ